MVQWEGLWRRLTAKICKKRSLPKTYHTQGDEETARAVGQHPNSSRLRNDHNSGGMETMPHTVNEV